VTGQDDEQIRSLKDGLERLGGQGRLLKGIRSEAKGRGCFQRLEQGVRENPGAHELLIEGANQSVRVREDELQVREQRPDAGQQGDLGRSGSQIGQTGLEQQPGGAESFVGPPKEPERIVDHDRLSSILTVQKLLLCGNLFGVVQFREATMYRDRILIIDPSTHRREQLERQLSLRFEVVTAASTTDGLAAFDAKVPRAVVATLNQTAGHGLELCQMLRELPGGEHSYLLVYGLVKRSVFSREGIERKWRVDAFFPQLLEPEAVESHLWHVLARAGERRDMITDPGFPLPVFSSHGRGPSSSALSSSGSYPRMTRPQVPRVAPSSRPESVSPGAVQAPSLGTASSDTVPETASRSSLRRTRTAHPRRVGHWLGMNFFRSLKDRLIEILPPPGPVLGTVEISKLTWYELLNARITFETFRCLFGLRIGSSQR